MKHYYTKEQRDNIFKYHLEHPDLTLKQKAKNLNISYMVLYQMKSSKWWKEMEAEEIKKNLNSNVSEASIEKKIDDPILEKILKDVLKVDYNETDVYLVARNKRVLK